MSSHPQAVNSAPRQLSPQRRAGAVLPVRQEFVYQVPERCQNDQGHKRPDPDNKIHHPAQEGQMFIKHHTDTVSEYRKYKRQHDRQKEDHRIQRRPQTQIDIISCLYVGIDTVQPGCDRQNAFPC